jgi:hypothetical protein
MARDAARLWFTGENADEGDVAAAEEAKVTWEATSRGAAEADGRGKVISLWGKGTGVARSAVMAIGKEGLRQEGFCGGSRGEPSAEEARENPKRRGGLERSELSVSGSRLGWAGLTVEIPGWCARRPRSSGMSSTEEAEEYPEERLGRDLAELSLSTSSKGVSLGGKGRRRLVAKGGMGREFAGRAA